MTENENFKVTSRTGRKGVTVVTIEGQIMTGEARSLTIYFRELFAGGVRDIIVDMSGVTYACSAILAFFISACSGYTKEGLSFNAAFCGLPPNVERTLESLGLASLLRIAKDESVAMKLLRGK